MKKNNKLIALDDITIREPLAPLPQGWYALRYRILADGGLAVLASDVDLESERRRIYQAKGEPSPPSQMDKMAKRGKAKLFTWSDRMWGEELSLPLESPFLIFDRFADGRWLVVGTRTDRRPNGRILLPDGKVVKRIMLGDGIEHVGIDRADGIWVGWFDEGVFGNDKWKVSGLEWPPSAVGVRCFSGEGGIVPTSEWPSDVDAIADCYALNVIDRHAWVCAYTDFAIVRLGYDGARWWHSRLSGPSAIAVCDHHVIAAGGYGEDANRLILLELDENLCGGKAISRAQGRLPMRRSPFKDDWTPVWVTPALLTGCGDTLHLVDDGVWYQWRVMDVVESLSNVA